MKKPTFKKRNPEADHFQGLIEDAKAKEKFWKGFPSVNADGELNQVSTFDDDPVDGFVFKRKKKKS